VLIIQQQITSLVFFIKGCVDKSIICTTRRSFRLIATNGANLIFTIFELVGLMKTIVKISSYSKFEMCSLNNFQVTAVNYISFFYNGGLQIYILIHVYQVKCNLTCVNDCCSIVLFVIYRPQKAYTYTHIIDKHRTGHIYETYIDSVL